ncbi:MAG: methyltransferase domain-containing protein [Acidobacteria bacterium]|nr:methyltransferase domain-containing protein [Acidobacteriota bacterium]
MNEKLREEFNQWVLDGRSAQLKLHHLSFVEEVIQRMKVRPRDRILEVGCGEGWAARLLAPLVPEGSVVGLDVSDEMIRKARAQSAEFENLLFLWADAEEIPWQEKFFTHSLYIETLYYFENPEKALREIYRVLAPGGAVWIVNHLSKENELSLRWLEDFNVPVQLLSVEEYGELFRRCGFQEFVHCMIPDYSPDFERSYSRWFPDPAELHCFQELGALLLSAQRPPE